MTVRTVMARGLTLSAVLIGGCAIDITMDSSPDTVQVGDQVTYEISMTNRTSCTLPVAGFNFVPLLDEQEQEAATGELLDRLGITLQDLCTAAETGVPPVLNPPNPAAEARMTAFMESASATPIVAGAVTCMEMTDTNTGITGQQCGVTDLAPGGTENVTLMATADAPGTFLNFAASVTRAAGVCRGGANAGDACNNNSSCDSDECADGFCVGGPTPDDGCDDDTQCGSGGACTSCERCVTAGFCSGASDEPGADCFEKDDCPGGECVCGVSIVCSETTVVEPQPNGSGCTENIQCESLVCEDAVCCEAVCGEMQACNIVGSEGECTDITAAAPAVSRRGLALAFLLLGAVGALGIFRLGHGRGS